MFDLSAGGISVLVDRGILNRVRAAERFFATFALPSTNRKLCMLAAVRHSRVVEPSGSLRIGLSFRPWGGGRLAHDQRRILQFVAAHERRLLRRRL
jgi:hypothetical protein